MAIDINSYVVSSASGGSSKPSIYGRLRKAKQKWEDQI
jgi:hypothetical protein